MNSRISRRNFVKGSTATGIGLAFVPGSIPVGPPKTKNQMPPKVDHVDPDSTFFATALVETFGSRDTASEGDLWPSCWSDDDNLYTANGDGRGFGDQFDDIVINRVFGTPDTGMTGEALASGAEIANVWADPINYNRKPTGVVSVDGNGDGTDELYLAVQDLRKPPCPACFNDAPNASISKSEDYGRTWQKTAAPMFTDHRFTTIFFLDYGKSNEHAGVLGPEGAQYVYAYGIDYNWRDPTQEVKPTPTDLYLARVPKDSVQERSAWEFYANPTPRGRPTWSADVDKRRSVLHDDRTVYPALRCDGRPIGDLAQNVGVISQGSVVYNLSLDRYIYTSWTWYTFEFYEAPQPWGPWKLFMRKDFGGAQWFGESDGPGCPGLNEGGYPTTIPSKFISSDGKTMWVQSNSWERWNYACGSPNYNFSLRKLQIEPFIPTEPTNQPDSTNNLAMTGEGTTPIEKSARHGRVNFYNDGVKNQNESSYDCDEFKPLDFWGYTWKRRYNVDRVVYTTGSTFFDGGWFGSSGGGLRVQVRQDFQWVDVTGLSIAPDYPYDQSAGPNKSYVLTFEDTWGDGVRIVGPPGGAAHFTTIAELEVYFVGE